MKVYLLNSWETYYPNTDNTVKVFLTEESANKFVEEHIVERRVQGFYSKDQGPIEQRGKEYDYIVKDLFIPSEHLDPNIYPEGVYCYSGEYEIYKKEINE